MSDLSEEFSDHSASSVKPDQKRKRSTAENGGSISKVSKVPVAKTVFNRGGASMLLMANGRVQLFGAKKYGGHAGAKAPLLVDVLEVVATDGAFAARKSDDSVVVWGDVDYGGDAGAKQDLLDDVELIVASRAAFAAKKRDGSVVTWGHGGAGGKGTEVPLANIMAIGAAPFAFCAIDNLGRAFCWGSRRDFEEALKSCRKAMTTDKMASLTPTVSQDNSTSNTVSPSQMEKNQVVSKSTSAFPLKSKKLKANGEKICFTFLESTGKFRCECGKETLNHSTHVERTCRLNPNRKPIKETRIGDKRRKPRKCDLCEKKIVNVKRHKRTAHKCEICSALSGGKEVFFKDLKTHLLSHIE